MSRRRRMALEPPVLLERSPSHRPSGDLLFFVFERIRSVGDKPALTLDAASEVEAGAVWRRPTLFDAVVAGNRCTIDLRFQRLDPS